MIYLQPPAAAVLAGAADLAGFDLGVSMTFTSHSDPVMTILSLR